MDRESLYDRWQKSFGLSFVQIRKGEWRFESVDSPEGWWTVYYNGRDYACTCPDFLEDYRDQTRWWKSTRVDKVFSDCKHILAVRERRHDLEGLPLPKIYRTSKQEPKCGCDCKGGGSCDCNCGTKCGDRPKDKAVRLGDCWYNCYVEPQGGYEQRVPNYEKQGITELVIEPTVYACPGQTIGLRINRLGENSGYTNIRLVSDFPAFSKNNVSTNQLAALRKQVGLSVILGTDGLGVLQSSALNQVDTTFTPYQRSLSISISVPPDTATGVYTFVLTSTNAAVKDAIAYMIVQDCPYGLPPWNYKSSPFCLEGFIYYPGGQTSTMPDLFNLSPSERSEVIQMQLLGCYPDDLFPGRIGSRTAKCYQLNSEGRQELIDEFDLPDFPVCDGIADVSCPPTEEPPECYPGRGGYNAIQRIVTGRKIVDTNTCSASCEIICTRVNVPECPPPRDDDPPPDSSDVSSCTYPARNCITLPISNLSSAGFNLPCPSGYSNAGYVIYGNPPSRGFYFCCSDVDESSQPVGNGCDKTQTPVSDRYRCEDGKCIPDPNGIYASLADCQNALVSPGFSGGQCTGRYRTKITRWHYSWNHFTNQWESYSFHTTYGWSELGIFGPIKGFKLVGFPDTPYGHHFRVVHGPSNTETLLDAIGGSSPPVISGWTVFYGPYQSYGSYKYVYTVDAIEYLDGLDNCGDPPKVCPS